LTCCGDTGRIVGAGGDVDRPREEVYRIVGLEMGADDYLPKPFNPRELVARIRAIQRRQSTAQKDGTAAEAVLVVGDLVWIRAGGPCCRVSAPCR